MYGILEKDQEALNSFKKKCIEPTIKTFSKKNVQKTFWNGLRYEDT